MTALVRKTCNVLIQLREQDYTCADLALRVGEPRNSVHGILVELVDMGLVERVRSKQVFGMGSPPYIYSLAKMWKGMV